MKIKTAGKVIGSRLGAVSRCKQKKRLRERTGAGLSLNWSSWTGIDEDFAEALPSSSPGHAIGSKDSGHEPRPLSWLVHDDPGWEHVPRLAWSTHLDLQVGFAVPAALPLHQGPSQPRLIPQEGSSPSTELGNQTCIPAGSCSPTNLAPWERPACPRAHPPRLGRGIKRNLQILCWINLLIAPSDLPSHGKTGSWLLPGVFAIVALVVYLELVYCSGFPVFLCLPLSSNIRLV